MADNNAGWAEHIEAIESSYEFMLAYAAQGRENDDTGAGSQIREYLTKMNAALEDVVATAAKLAEEKGLTHYQPFLDTMDIDAKKAQTVIQYILARPSLSSQLIDNVNASIHVRALLTDLFLIDETLK
ncbi:MAG: hypothetical protein VX603_14550 [Gemmatimonadota bacterium]|nr:hypothetical protein [Gemmatimonadota bacterium]